MTEFITTKMKNGTDLVGIREYEDEYMIRINNPIEMSIQPEYGVFAKSWLYFSKTNSITLSKKDLLMIDDANDDAVKYYEQFIYQFIDQSDNTKNDQEDLLKDFMQSKMSIKH